MYLLGDLGLLQKWPIRDYFRERRSAHLHRAAPLLLLDFEHLDVEFLHRRVAVGIVRVAAVVRVVTVERIAPLLCGEAETRSQHYAAQIAVVIAASANGYSLS